MLNFQYLINYNHYTKIEREINMKKITKTLTIATLFCAALSLTFTATTSAAVRTTGSNANNQYKLVWSDEFDGTELDKNNWNYDTGNWGWGNNELQNYTDSEDNVKVENGCLVLTARAEKNGDKTTYTSGRVNSSGKAYFKYGKLEARIKLPDDKGLWPAFWMLGQFEPKGWPYCGEIDILETWNFAHFVQGTLHYEDELYKPKEDTYLATRTSMTNKTQWHTYGIEWTPTTIEWTLDDEVFKTENITASTMSEIRKEFYFVINCAVGGNLARMAPIESFQSAEVKVDYVRVYQKKWNGPTLSFKSNDKDLVDEHSVLFISNDNVISTQNLKDGETAVLPTITRKGYKFAGWYCGNDEVTDRTRFYGDADKNVVAKWIKIKNGKVTLKKTKQRYKKYVTVKYTYKKSANQKADGFQIKVGNKTTTTPSKIVTFGKFKSKKTYKVKVRAYQIDSRGVKIYGKWSKSMKIRVK